MPILNNGYFMKSFNELGYKSKCGCVEFTFENLTWFTSRTKLGAILLILFASIIIGFIFNQNKKVQIYSICIVTVLLVVLFMKMFFCVKKETLYVIAPIGVQFITSYLFGKESVLFIPWHSLKSFVIVEVIVGQQILFYLGLQNRINNSDGLVLLFQNTRPRLRHLEEMYRIILEHTPAS